MFRDLTAKSPRNAKDAKVCSAGSRRYKTGAVATDTIANFQLPIFDWIPGKGQLAITNRQSPIVIGRYRFSPILNNCYSLAFLAVRGDLAASFVIVIIKR